MDWLPSIVSGLVSAASVTAVITFVARQSFQTFVDRRLESFKHDLGVEATRRQLALQSQIQFKERQLSELYGPIYAYLKRIRPIDDLWNEGRLKSIEAAAKQVIRESNDRIVEIILAKCHLIDGDCIPASYTRFLTHVPIWHAFLDAPGNWNDYHNLTEALYDMDFEREIYSTTEKLKRELHQLHSAYGLNFLTSDAAS